MSSRLVNIDVWRAGLCAVAMSLLLGCASHGETNARAVRPIDGKKVGSTLRDFGLTLPGTEGVSTLNKDMIVRWQTIEGIPIVTALATAWSQKDQEHFIT